MGVPRAPAGITVIYYFLKISDSFSKLQLLGSRAEGRH